MSHKMPLKQLFSLCLLLVSVCLVLIMQFFTHYITHAEDLAVDWIEDMLYWTSGQIDTRIYKLDITTIGLNTPQIVEIPVNIETATFTYIVLNPINRYVYMDQSHHYLIYTPYNTGILL